MNLCRPWVDIYGKPLLILQSMSKEAYILKKLVLTESSCLWNNFQHVQKYVDLMVTATEMLVHYVHAFAISVISGAMFLHRVKTPVSVLLAPMSVFHQPNAWTRLGLTVANVLPLLDGPLMAERVLILMSVNTQTCATHRLHATTTLEDLNAVVI